MSTFSFPNLEDVSLREKTTTSTELALRDVVVWVASELDMSKASD